MKRKRLSEIFEFKSGSTPTKSNHNFWNGDFPWVTAKDLKTSFISSTLPSLSEKGVKSSKIVPAGSLLILVRGMTLFKDVPVTLTLREVSFNQDIKALVPKIPINPKYILYYLVYSKEHLKKLVDSAGHGTGRIDSDLLKNFPVFIPSIETQDAIANIIEKIDICNQKIEALIAAKKKRFGWLVTKLINKSDQKKMPLSKFISEISKRNHENKIDRVLSVTNHSGFVLPEDQFERRVASTDVSNYKIVTYGQYAYNPSRINVGSIARLDKWNDGVLSPMYTVFELDESILNTDYFLHWLSSSEAKQRIKKSAQGSVRETVSFGDLQAIPIPHPSLEIPKDIVLVLNTAFKKNV